MEDSIDCDMEEEFLPLKYAIEGVGYYLSLRCYGNNQKLGFA